MLILSFIVIAGGLFLSALAGLALGWLLGETHFFLFYTLPAKRNKKWLEKHLSGQLDATEIFRN